jgi:hypothetical protein
VELTRQIVSGHLSEDTDEKGPKRTCRPVDAVHVERVVDVKLNAKLGFRV